MESGKVIGMNEDYKRITGEEVYLYASKPKGSTLYVFCNAQILGHQGAEQHMAAMLEAAERGMGHQDIVSKFDKRGEPGRARRLQ